MITNSTHPHFDSNQSEWATIRRFYTGEGVEKELNERYFEENREHFQQRKRDADFTPLTRHLLSRLVGLLFQQEDDVTRQMGEITEEDLRTAGSGGEDFIVLIQNLAEKLLAFNSAYIVFRPNSGFDVVSPLSVPIWTDAETVVTSKRTIGDSVFNDVEQVKTWTRYTPRGYETYRQIEEGGEQKDDLIDSGVWAVNEDGESNAFFVDESGDPTPPVIHVRMPWEARFGYLLAKKHKAIYEMRSRRDFAASTAMNGMLQVGVGASDGDDELAQMLKDAIKDANILPYRKDYGKHQGIAYPTDGVKAGTKILEAKQKEMKETAYRLLDESTRKSATEAAIQHASGAGAALAITAKTIEDAEQKIFRLWSQSKDMTLAGPNPRSIDVRVDWPTDYSDIVGSREMVDKVFPSGIPLDVETAVDVVVDYVEERGIEVDEDRRGAIRERIEQKRSRDDQAASAAGFGL